MNENTRQRILNFSETPPASAWPRIAEELDKPAFAQKLRDFETAPPTATWENVKSQLSQPAVVPLRAKLFKYAIAAAVLIAVAVGSIFYFKPGTSSNVATTAPSNRSATKNSLVETTPQSETISNEQTTEDNNTSMVAEARGALVHFSPQVDIPKKVPETKAAVIVPSEKKIEKTAINTELLDRYMIATTASGKAVRLPKKAYDDYACAELHQNYLCKERLAAIQTKLAASVATDFTDFIDLLKNLQDNQ